MTLQESWSKTITKTIKLAKNAGFCYGVKRAVDTTKKIKQENPSKSVSVLGELIHNSHVTNELECLGIETLNSLPEAGEGICIIRSHGESDSTFEEIKSKDPITAEKVHINNKVRLVRVLEVMRTFGRPFSQVAGKKEDEYDVEWVSPQISSREILYERINKRVDKMLENGLIEETKSLLEKHGRIKNFAKTIGYAEMLEYLDGFATLEESIEKLKQNTRRYAKRQLTWFRRNPELNMDY